MQEFYFLNDSLAFYLNELQVIYILFSASLAFTGYSGINGVQRTEKMKCLTAWIIIKYSIILLC